MPGRSDEATASSSTIFTLTVSVWHCPLLRRCRELPFYCQSYA